MMITPPTILMMRNMVEDILSTKISSEKRAGERDKTAAKRII